MSAVGIISRGASVKGAFLGLLCGVLVWSVSLLGWTQSLERNLLDSLFRLRGTRYPSGNIILLVADDATVARAGTYPLPRRIYADAVRKLTAAGVKTIAFDLLFSTPSDLPSDDRELIEACRASRRVVQTTAFHVPALYSATQPNFGHADMGPPAARFHVSPQGKAPYHARNAVWASSAMPALQVSAPALGHINVYPSVDGALRSIPNIVAYRGQLYPSLALATAAAYLGVAPNHVRVHGDKVVVGSREIPINADGETLINWVGGNRSFPTFSFKQLAEGRVPLGMLKGRIVLMGATAAASFEHHPTPFSPVQPAIELQANAIDDILMNRPLYLVAAWLRVLLVLAFAALAGAITAPRRVFAGLGQALAASIGLLLIGVLIMSRLNLYLPLGGPLLAGVLAVGLSTAASARREWQANWQSDASVTALARGATLLSTWHRDDRFSDVIRETVQATLGADEVFLVLPWQPSEERPELIDTLNALANLVAADGRAILWPRSSDSTKMTRWRTQHNEVRAGDALTERDIRPTSAGPGAYTRTAPARLTGLRERGYLPTPDDRLNELFTALCRELSDNTKNSLFSSFSAVAAPLPPTPLDDVTPGIFQRFQGGALIAVMRGAKQFTEREAALAEALAQQIALALENQSYAARLRSRIDLANRDLRDAYQILTEQSTKLTAAVESVDDALIITDENGDAIFVNPASARTLLAATPSLGENVAQRLREHGLEPLAELFDRMAETEYAHDWKARCETVMDIGGTQGQKILAAQLAPLPGESGRPIGTMLVVTDVTAERRLDSAKSDFVSFVAHELRTPLTTILGYASLLHGDVGEFPLVQRIEMTGAIMHHCRRLNRMITEMLDLARAEAGHALDLRLEMFDLVELCEQVIEAQNAAIANANDYFLYLDATGDINVLADRDRIEQVLTNLISNAVKYSPEGGTVRLGVKRENAEVLFWVTDTGMGMTEEEQAQLFQKFYRTSEAQKSGIKGTGLGLFLVKKLIEAHGGSITAESEQGRGTTFTVRLPQ